MPAFLRKKLTCFYCGSRSAQTRVPGLRSWQCEKCEAENWLDENGEITDPPTSSSLPDQNPRFAQSIVTPFTTLDPIPATSKPEPLFCSTCVKNQHLYNESLANFYPSPTHCDFKGYEKAEENFRKSLEERYPIICEECEPRVRARLKKANYNAKADHLLRTQDKLRARKIQNAGLKGFVVRLGGLMWALSWIVQMGWHILGLIDLAAVDDQNEKATFPLNYLEQFEVMRTLHLIDDDYTCLALWVGFGSIWWHPKLLEKVVKPFSKLQGLSKFYKIQIVSLMMRLIIWYWITHQSLSNIESIRGIHLFSTMLGLLSIIASFRTVYVTYSPNIYFKESPEPLIKRRSRSATDMSQLPPTQPSFQRDSAPINHPRPFSINDLAPHTQTPSNISTPRLPTPPPEADYDDPTAMDWSPTTAPLKSSSTHYLPPRLMPQHSPFHGALPQNIHPPSHRLRNPTTTTPFFRAATAAQKASLWPTSKPSTHKPAKPASPLWRTRSTGHPLDMHSLNQAIEDQAFTTTTHSEIVTDDRLKNLDPNSLSPQKCDAFARPRFFPQGDLQNETGLEGIMEQAFQIGDTPREVFEQRVQDKGLAQREGAGDRGVRARAIVGVGIAVVIVAVLWRFAWQTLEHKPVDGVVLGFGDRERGGGVSAWFKETGKWFLGM